MDKQRTGQIGEKIAVDFLQKEGFKIVETNFKSRFGEIDIIAREDDILVFIEVKTRYSRQFGLPEEAVGPRKISHIIKTIAVYRTNHKNLPQGDRVDVVAIELSVDGETRRVELIKNVTG